MSYFRYLCLFVYSGVQHMSCLVYPMLPVSLDCPFLIDPSVFSNVYLHQKMFATFTLFYYSKVWRMINQGDFGFSYFVMLIFFI